MGPRAAHAEPVKKRDVRILSFGDVSNVRNVPLTVENATARVHADFGVTQTAVGPDNKYFVFWLKRVFHHVGIFKNPAT